MNNTFEHMFIPKIVENSNKNDFELDSVEIFDDFEFVDGCFSDYYPKEAKAFDWKSFSITKEMNINVQYWVLTFPEPSEEREAKWGMIVKKDKKPFKYFTLNLAGGDKMVLCSFKDGGSEEIATVEKTASKQDFISMVLENK